MHCNRNCSLPVTTSLGCSTFIYNYPTNLCFENADLPISKQAALFAGDDRVETGSRGGYPRRLHGCYFGGAGQEEDELELLCLREFCAVRSEAVRFL